MKKFFVLFLVLVTGFVLVSCGGDKYEVAMITDTGDIDDGSFNEGTWKGIVKYAEDHGVSHKYYKPGGETHADYEAAIDLAVANGAKVVITPGFYFETPIFNAQTKYPNVKFVILDGEPHNGDYNVVVAENTLAVFFKEEQAGFLAGYAAVKDGFTKLGYMGGIAVPAVQRFGIGWVAGAYQAAKELGLDEFKFEAEYYMYLGTFGPSDTYKTTAASWFEKIDVIHAAAGGAGSSVMAAAEDATGKWVVGVDSDQSGDSNTVISSAVKGVGEAAYQALEDFYAEKFPGGKTWNLGANEDAVSLPTTSKWRTFSTADYNTLFGKVKDNTYKVPATAEALVAYVKALGYAEADIQAVADKV